MTDQLVQSIQARIEAIQAANLKELARQALYAFAASFSESEGQIATAAAELEDGKPLALGFSVRFDLGKSKAKFKLSFSTAYNCETEAAIEPGQALLDLQ
jgi:hypothetical protein